MTAVLNCLGRLHAITLYTGWKSHSERVSAVVRVPNGARRIYRDFLNLRWLSLPVFFDFGPGFDLESRFWRERPSDFDDEFSGLLFMQGLMGAIAIVLNAGPPLILRKWAAWCLSNAVPEKEVGRRIGCHDPQFLEALRRVRLAPGEELGRGIGPNDPVAFGQFLRVAHRTPAPPAARDLAPHWASMFEEYSLSDVSLPFLLRVSEDNKAKAPPTEPHPGVPEVGLPCMIQRFTQHFDTWSWKGLLAIFARLLANPKMPGLRREILALALRESLLFERFGWVISRCEHGSHWFVSNDRRRKDCIVHRRAGQQARWRQRHAEWKRAHQRAATGGAKRKPRLATQARSGTRPRA